MLPNQSKKSMDELKDKIQAAFAEVEYPGGSILRNSDEGEEPFLLEEAFQGKDDWRTLAPEFIDQAPDGFASALSFFSAQAFRFYLPAYILADLADQLRHTDLLFYLTHGLTDTTKDVLINPRRYGNLTWFEYSSQRFSVFTTEEAQAIVAYFHHKLDQDLLDNERDQINQSLAHYWNKAATIATGLALIIHAGCRCLGTNNLYLEESECQWEFPVSFGLSIPKGSIPENAIVDFFHLDRMYAESFYNRGRAYALVGDYGKALTDFNLAIHLNPAFALA